MTEDTMLDRIDRRVRELGMTDRGASMLATGKPDTIRDAKRKGYMPKGDTLAALAEALETTVEYLRFGRNTGTAFSDRRTGYEPSPAATGRIEQPKDIPVYGTALGGGEVIENGVEVETHIIEHTTEIDHIEHPPSYSGRRDIYGLYVHGTSMHPRYDPGDPVYVDPRKPPRNGDDVIVQLARDNGDDTEVYAALIKTLVRRTPTALELRQYNPAMTFTIPVERVRHVHRVLSRNDLAG